MLIALRKLISNIGNTSYIFLVVTLLVSSYTLNSQKEYSYGFEPKEEVPSITGPVENKSSEFSHSGKYAQKVTEKSPFGISYSIKNLDQNQWIYLEVWKYGKLGHLVASCSDIGFYQTSGEVWEKSRSWDKVVMWMQVPPNYDGEEFRFYFYNPNDSRTYIDDFKISIGKSRVYPEHDSLPKIQLEIKDENFDDLLKYRKKAFINGKIGKKSKKWKKAKLISVADTYKCKIRFKGDWLDHLTNDKWSFRIKLSDKKQSYKRLKTFNIQHPKTRNYLNEWTLHRMFKQEDILTTRYEFCQVLVNGQNRGIFAMEQHFDKILLESNGRREGPIMHFDEDGFWEVIKTKKEFPELEISQEHFAYDVADIVPFSDGKVKKSSLLYEQFITGMNILDRIRHLDTNALGLLDKRAFASFFAITDIFESYHSLAWINLRFYYNPVSGLIEPVAYDGFGGTDKGQWNSTPLLGYIDVEHETIYSKAQYFVAFLLNDDELRKYYFDYLQQYTSDDYLSTFFGNKFQGAMSSIYQSLKKEFPFYTYTQVEDIYQRAEDIRAILKRDSNLVSASHKFHYYPLWDFLTDHVDDPNIPPFIDSIFFESISVSSFKLYDEIYVTNKQPYTIKVIQYENKNDEVLKLNTPLTINGYEAGEPLTFTKIPVEGAKKIFYELNDKIEKVKVSKLPTQPIEQFQQAPPLNYKQYFELNNNVLTPKKKDLIIDKPVITPKNVLLNMNEGSIRFVDNGCLIVRGSCEMEGGYNNPIIITGENKKNGFVVIAENNITSSVEHVDFSGLGQPQVANYYPTGGVAFYQSKVTFTNCRFSDSRGEDMLNLFDCNSKVSRCEFTYAMSDGLDVDFGELSLYNTRFEVAGNDLLDLSGCITTVSGALFIQAGDKAISCGEGSSGKISGVFISQAATGIAIKDLSDMLIKQSTIGKCEVGVSAYQKKGEYGGGKATLSRNAFVNNEKDTEVDKVSEIINEE